MALQTLSTESIFQQLRYIFQFDHVAFWGVSDSFICQIVDYTAVNG